MDLRANLVDAMRIRLNDYYADRPTSPVPVAVPMGVFADAALEVLADGRPVPRVPVYDPETAEARLWHGKCRAGEPIRALHVERDGGEVVVTVTGGDGTLPVRLIEQDAVDFALGVISAARAGVSVGS